jgi:betaine-homocysteine S-methyltransferase
MTGTSGTLADRLAQGTVLGAEGYVFELERRGYVKAGAYVPEAVLDFPDAVAELHREFLRAGADVMVALTYYAHRGKLRQLGRESELEAMNRQAVRLARQVAAEGGALVAGNVCNTWAYDPHDPASADVVRAMYAEQLGWAADEGIDFVIAETNDYLGEALIGLEVSQELGLPAMVTQPVPYRTTEASPTMESLRAEGVNRVFPLALDPFSCTRFEMADFAVAARDLGVSYVGICCGAGPHHVRAMAEALGRTVPASRYSPSMELHPVLGTAASRQDRAVLDAWNATL